MTSRDAGGDREAFASQFARFVQAMNVEAQPVASPIGDRAEAHLGVDPLTLSVISEELALYDRPNLQLALQRWLDEGAGQRSLEACGVVAPEMRYMGLGLGDLVSLRSVQSARVDIGPVSYSESRLPNGDRLLCYQSALLSLTDGDERLLALIGHSPQTRPGEPPVRLQVMATREPVASGFLAELRRLRDESNIYRGQVLSVGKGDERNPFSDELTLQLVDTAAIARSDVILADGVLEQIERHTVHFGRHAERLRAAGRALRRGVLLYGPPGTGKTHTVRYLSSAMAGRTTFIISGATFGVLAPICQMARDLAPAMVVLEDVDLVAQERTLPGPGRPLLFTLMNEMDGIGADADVVFLLTTNRADLVEPALAARPGRIDLAVEVPVPDRLSRSRLIELYGVGLDVRVQDAERLLARTDGVSAAFIKELMRRAALLAAEQQPDGVGLTVGDQELDQALDEMLAAGGSLGRSLVGASPGPAGSEGGPGEPIPGLGLPAHVRSALLAAGAPIASDPAGP